MATREEYVAKMKQQLDEWNTEIGKLETRLADASDATKQRLEPHLAKARDARDVVAKKLTALKGSSEASWDSARDDIEHVWKVFKQTVNYFKSQL
jgi:septal ring factor EnvC (AmiA/AmiB activator)